MSVGGGSQLWEVIRQSSVNKGVVVMQISVLNPLIRVSLINVNVSYKRVTSTSFSEFLLGPPFLKNNLLQIILMPRRHILGHQFSS